MSSNQAVKKIRYALRFLPDSLYIQLNYFAHFKRFAHLKKPCTYNEKLNWLKLHDHNPIYTKLVDKYEAKKYIENQIGGGYCIPTLGVWEHFDEIDFDVLPEQFVLKCTHDSEGVVIVKNKNLFDINNARIKIETALKQNFFFIGREWAYKNVKPRIIAEPYMEDTVDGELRDYKFFCFNGEPKAMFIASGRSIGETKFDYFDLNFNHFNIKQKYPNSTIPLRKPNTFNKMIEISRILSKNFPHIRVDFYEVDGKCYVGELTLFHFSGFMPFQPNEWDQIFGNWIDLSKVQGEQNWK